MKGWLIIKSYWGGADDGGILAKKLVASKGKGSG